MTSCVQSTLTDWRQPNLQSIWEFRGSLQSWCANIHAYLFHAVQKVLPKISALTTLETNRPTETALTPLWGCGISMRRLCKLMGPTTQAVQWRLMCALSKQMTSIDSLENGDDIASTRGRRNCQKCSALGVEVHEK